MPLINYKIQVELNWTEDCILSSAGDPARFKLLDPKLHVPISTLSTKDNVNLTKQVIDLKDLFIGTIIRLFLRKW